MGHYSIITVYYNVVYKGWWCFFSLVAQEKKELSLGTHAARAEVVLHTCCVVIFFGDAEVEISYLTLRNCCSDVTLLLLSVVVVVSF